LELWAEGIFDVNSIDDLINWYDFEGQTL
jgi:hypothetical protein